VISCARSSSSTGDRALGRGVLPGDEEGEEEEVVEEADRSAREPSTGNAPPCAERSWDKVPKQSAA
jgi:hypothetical protein